MFICFPSVAEYTTAGSAPTSASVAENITARSALPSASVAEYTTAGSAPTSALVAEYITAGSALPSASVAEYITAAHGRSILLRFLVSPFFYRLTYINENQTTQYIF